MRARRDAERRSSHQLEEPDAFNRHLADFFQAVEVGTWPKRDPRALVASILGGR